MDPRYGERYRELYERHWWWRARARFVNDVVRRRKPKQGWQNILDIGCGDGLFFPELSQFGEVEGVEPFAELVNPTNPYRSRIHIVPFDENFQPQKRYSLILMLDVLEHLEDAIAAGGTFHCYRASFHVTLDQSRRDEPSLHSLYEIKLPASGATGGLAN
jgi:2-polyprenyl-3-methyl-5-hydroxy-6-metoxy-1,4-benzoquinol methylase